MTQKVVVITGASSGIGAALARNLGARGDRLVLAARREALLKKVASDSGAEAITVVADVTKRKDVEKIRDAAMAKFGHVDVWVSNAGYATGKKVMDLTDQEFQEIIDVVLKSVFYGMQTIVPHFQERGEGHLINVSSTLGRVPIVSFRSVYSASKAAVNSLSSNLRMDLRKYPNIKVSTVLPGMVDTNFHAVAGSPFRPKAGEKVGQAVVMSAEQVAEQIANLIDHPVPELYIPAGGAELAKQYFQDVGAFEERMAQW
ncbi:MAG: SDR family NAD(P)-dependent oxidoreductase [Thaumarchaeota archaeon]|nr:SDR family NAD(P)-dependent oxidoreductase [Nitrososphaerota archaeon]